MKYLALCLALIAPQANAQALTLSEFEALVAGRTLTYANQGSAPFGIERYGPDRTVTWAPEDGDCLTGSYAQGSGDYICMDYGNFDFCLSFFPSATGLRGVDDEGIKYEMTFTTETAACFPNP